MTADIRTLAAPSWRGIMFPAKELRHRFAHEQSPAHVSYGTGDFFDMTGTRARSWTAKIPFNESLKNWETLFSKTYPAFYEAMRDRSPGTLVTPLQGPVLCVPGSYEDDLSPMILDGVSVDCTWSEHTPVTGSNTDAPPNLAALFTDANALDKQVSGMSWDGSKPLPTADLLTAIAATGNQLSTARDKVKANVLGVAQRANAVEVSMERLGSNGGPKANAVRLAARKLRLDSERVANAPPREVVGDIAQITTDGPKTVMQLARESGMDLKDFLDLNYTLAKQISVPPGTKIFVKR
jgi:hypothetical protein